MFARPSRFSVACWRLAGSAALLLVLLSGCATAPAPLSTREFHFGQDTFSYPNELVWEYEFDPATGKTSHHRRDPPAQYSHRCFVVARTALQFYNAAQFEPSAPPISDKELGRRIEAVVDSNPREVRPFEDRIVIPGYTNLFQLSASRPDLLKPECGGPLASYFQRGHWRMILPFSRAHQARMGEQLAEQTRRGQPAVVHVVVFPQLKINHAIVLYASHEDPQQIVFDVYDPNTPEQPTSLTYDRKGRTFSFPRNHYFSGGPVDIYQVYHHWNY